MTDLLQIFTGNPLTTFVGKKIEAATRPELEAEDWALNMEICDIINENDEDAKDAARAIKKRLSQIEQDRNFVVTNRTLTVLDTCVSNCSHRFHVLVMTKDFIQDLVKLIGPKNNPPIELQERVLSMIERWADAFRNQPDLGGVVSVCNDLKAKGVVFPPRDPSSHVPIQTPQRTVPPAARPEARSLTQQTMQRPGSGGAGPGAAMSMPQPPIGDIVPPQARQVAQQPPGQIVLEGEGYNKISQDLVVVQSSIEMFTDILNALGSPANEEADWRLADELSVTCRQMKDRIVDLIERVANEDLTIELLRLNDELNNIFTKYDQLVKDRAEALAAGDQQESTQPKEASNRQTAAQASSTLPGVSSRTLNELSLIDFNASGSSDSQKQQQATGTSAISSSSQSLTTTAAKAPAANLEDPFDTSNISVDKNNQPALAEDMSKLSLDTSGGPVVASAAAKKANGKAAGLPAEISSVREQDFAEIENWLSTDSGRDLASISGDLPSMEPISIPNSEFDNFIASRALAGSSTPSSQQPKDQQKKPEPSV